MENDLSSAKLGTRQTLPGMKRVHLPAMASVDDISDKNRFFRMREHGGRQWGRLGKFPPKVQAQPPGRLGGGPLERLFSCMLLRAEDCRSVELWNRRRRSPEPHHAVAGALKPAGISM